MPQPIWKRLVPLPLVRNRVVKTKMLDRVSQLVKGGVVPKPLWYEAMLAHPPPLKMQAEKPKRIDFPEDRLRRVWLRRNPESTMHPKTLFVEEAALPATHKEHPADAFVKRQMALMRKGLSEEEAYREVMRQQKQATSASPEAADARRAAMAFGAMPSGEAGVSGGGVLNEELLRKFAEEARAARMPYPEHWFAADGSWVGIRTKPPEAAPRQRPRQSPQRDNAVLEDLITGDSGRPKQ